MPTDLARAIRHAHLRLDIAANLMSAEEHPPEWKWLFPDELDMWLTHVKEERDRRFGGGSSSDSEEPMMRNELVDQWRREFAEN